MLTTRVATIAALALAALGCGTSAPGAQSAGQQGGLAPAHLRDGLEEIRARHRVPGIAAALVVGGHTAWSGTAGVRRVGARDTLEIGDRFHIASVTKGMTATLAAVLVREGRLQWTSTLADVIPEFRDRIRAEYRDATLERLLAHAARMPAYTQFGPKRLEELKALAGSPTQQRLAFLLSVLGSEPPNTGTGDAAYSNVGYTAAAAMLERAAGESWEDLLLTRLAQPLGMNLGFGWPATSRTPDQPRGHVTRGGRVVEQPLDDSYVLPAALWPAGAVNSSIGDLARYAADHLNGLRGRPALLPREAYQRQHRTLSGSPRGFTLGWGVRDDSTWGRVHYGAGSGGTFLVQILIAPEWDAAVVVAANTGDAAAATREAMDRLLREATAR